MNKKWNGEWMWAILVWNRVWETMGVGVQVWIGVSFYTQTTFLREGQRRIGGAGLTAGAVKIEETEMIKQWRWIEEVALTEEPLFKCSRILSGLRTDRVGARTLVLLFFALITYPTQLAVFKRLAGPTLNIAAKRHPGEIDSVFHWACKIHKK